MHSPSRVHNLIVLSSEPLIIVSLWTKGVYTRRMPYNSLMHSSSSVHNLIVLSQEPLIMVSLWTARAYTPRMPFEGLHAFPSGPQFDFSGFNVARAADDGILVDGEALTEDKNALRGSDHSPSRVHSLISLSSEPLMIVSLWTARASTRSECPLRVLMHLPVGVHSLISPGLSYSPEPLIIVSLWMARAYTAPDLVGSFS